MGHVPARAAAALGAVACALALAGIASAAPNPSPYDGGPTGLAVPALPALPTLPFPLGTDLSDVGVDQSTLAADGPNVQMAGANYGHPSGPSDGGSSGGGSQGSSGQHHTSRLWVVDDDRAECPSASFTTIQAAVDAASPGDFIEVCRGDYDAVSIPAGKDRLTIFGTGFLDVFIKAPSGPVAASPEDIVHVTGSKDVALINVVVTGPFANVADCATGFDGVRVDGGGSVVLLGDHITQIRPSLDALLGCQAGLGVLVGRASQAQTGSAVIGYSLIDNYEKGGVVVDNVGSSADIQHTIVQGIGSTPFTAQNGIQISRGATATVSFNEVTQNLYAPGTTTSAALLLYQAGTVNAGSNDTYQNDDGVDLVGTSNSSIANNYSHDQTDEGFYADSGSTGNTFAKNVAHNNTFLDCEDDSVGTKTAGTANTWTKDVGATASPPGICHH